MQTYRVELSSDVATSFRAIKASNSVDLDQKKKSVHEFEVQADLKDSYNLGLIVGASGSGKTTLAREIFGESFEQRIMDMSAPVIDQFPESMTYDECATMLTGIGLSQVPCWVRPAHTLSNGQRERAEVALRMSHAMDKQGVVVIDEWTSVVDRTVAKVMSHAVQKMARRNNKRVVLISCHYDVMEWLNPDWVIDCNKQTYINRRLLWRDYERQEQLSFEVRPVDRKTWRGFSRYHYLNDKLPGGATVCYGLFHGAEQIGFICFANYVPTRKGKTRIMHGARVVVHPDYVGLGLGRKLIDETADDVKRQGYRVMAKFSSVPVYKSMKKNPLWRLRDAYTHLTIVGEKMKRKGGFRNRVKTYSFEYIGNNKETEDAN